VQDQSPTTFDMIADASGFVRLRRHSGMVRQHHPEMTAHTSTFPQHAAGGVRALRCLRSCGPSAEAIASRVGTKKTLTGFSPATVICPSCQIAAHAAH
jgi:hypothetical protein